MPMHQSQVVFTEAVEVIGTPMLLLDLPGAAATSKYAKFIGYAAMDAQDANTPWNNNNELPGDFNVSSVSLTPATGYSLNVLTFVYEIAPDDATNALDYYSTAALVNSAGTNDAILKANTDTGFGLLAQRFEANLTLPQRGAVGSLGRESAIVINNLRPRIVDVTSTPKIVTAGDSLCVSVAYNIGNLTVLDTDSGAAVVPAGTVYQPTFASQAAAGVMQINLKLFPHPPIPYLPLYPGYLVPSDPPDFVFTTTALVPNVAARAANSSRNSTTTRSNSNSNSNSKNATSASTAAATVNTPVGNGAYLNVAFYKLKPSSTQGELDVRANLSSLAGASVNFCTLIDPSWPSGTLYLGMLEPMLFFNTTLVTQSGAELDPAAEFVPPAVGVKPLATVDNIPPYVVRVHSPNITQIYPFGVGDVIDLYVVFSKRIEVFANQTNAPRLQMLLTANPLTKNVLPYATYAGITDNRTSIKFQYLVKAGDVAYPLQYNGIYAMTGDVRRYGRKVSLIPAIMTLPPPSSLGSVSSCCSVLIDSLPPHVQSLFPLKHPGVYGANEVVFIVARFTKPVAVLGAPGPKLLLQTGATRVTNATYVTPATLFQYMPDGDSRHLLIDIVSTDVVFKYVVQADDNVYDLHHAGPDALQLPGTTQILYAASIPTHPADLTLRWYNDSQVRLSPRAPPCEGSHAAPQPLTVRAILMPPCSLSPLPCLAFCPRGRVRCAGAWWTGSGTRAARRRWSCCCETCTTPTRRRSR